MTDLIQQDFALRMQLVAIAGDEPAGSYFWVLTKRATASPVQDFIPVRELKHAAETAINRSRLGHVYVGCAPRISRSGGLEAVERVWILWAPDSGETDPVGDALDAAAGERP